MQPQPLYQRKCPVYKEYLKNAIEGENGHFFNEQICEHEATIQKTLQSQWSLIGIFSWTDIHAPLMFVYSYFEKGCRGKCMRQSWKALWVVLSSFFFSKKFEKIGTKGHGNVWVLKENNKSRFHSYSRQQQCIDHIPCYLSGLSHAHFFRQPFSK